MASKPPPPSQPLIRCPPYCRSNCAMKHHPLLVAITNCIDNTDEASMQQRIEDLRLVVTSYQSKHGWNINKEIPDVVEKYRQPIGHWACSLGRVKATSWLVANGFDATLKLANTEETPLHRALVTLQETCPHEGITKFKLLLPLLGKALLLGDDLGSTVLHVCCEMLKNDMPRVDFYAECVSLIIDFAKSCGQEVLQGLVNAQNNDGDTPLHIIANNANHVSVARLLVESGAMLTVKNLEGHTPMDIAIQSNQTGNVLCFYTLMKAGLGTHTTEERQTTQPTKPVFTSRVLYDKKGNVVGEEVRLNKPNLLADTTKLENQPASELQSSSQPTLVSRSAPSSTEYSTKQLGGTTESGTKSSIETATTAADASTNLVLMEHPDARSVLKEGPVKSVLTEHPVTKSFLTECPGTKSDQPSHVVQTNTASLLAPQPLPSTQASSKISSGTSTPRLSPSPVALAVVSSHSEQPSLDQYPSELHPDVPEPLDQHLKSPLQPEDMLHPDDTHMESEQHKLQPTVSGQHSPDDNATAEVMLNTDREGGSSQEWSTGFMEQVVSNSLNSAEMELGAMRSALKRAISDGKESPDIGLGIESNGPPSKHNHSNSDESGTSQQGSQPGSRSESPLLEEEMLNLPDPEQLHSELRMSREGVDDRTIAISLSDQEAFVAFLQSCGQDTCTSIRDTMATDKVETLNNLVAMQTKISGITSKLDKTQAGQKDSATKIQGLLERLNKLQQEEKNINSHVDKMQHEINTKMAAYAGLKERLVHCQSALQALDSLT